MAAVEVETEDERHSLLLNISRNGGIYKTTRSLRIRRRLGNWIYEGMSPDQGHNGRPYCFVFECCRLSVNIQHEILTNYYTPVRHNFHRFFPELDSIVAHPADYLRVVERITSGMEANNVTFSDGLLLDLQREGLLPPSAFGCLLPPSAFRAVRSSLSACPTFLSRKTLVKMGRACSRSLILDSMSKELDAFVHRGGRFGRLAPNLSALVGAAVAAKLIGAAGGLSKLFKLPISDIPLLSPAKCKKDESFAACSKLFDYPQHEQEQQQLPHDITQGYLAQTDLIRSTPQPRLRSKACNSLAERIHLVAEIDLNGTDPTGEKGRALEEEMRTMIEKWNDVEPAMLMKLSTELTERPKKKNLAVSKDYTKMFKPSLSKERSQYYCKMFESLLRGRIKRRNNMAKRVVPPPIGFGLPPTTAATTATATTPSSLKAI